MIYLVALSRTVFLRHITVHQHIVAEAAAHHKEVEDLMGSKIFVLGIEEGQFQRVNDAAHRIDDASGQEPCERRAGQGL